MTVGISSGNPHEPISGEESHQEVLLDCSVRACPLPACRLHLPVVRLRRMKLILELLIELLVFMLSGPKKRKQRTRNKNRHNQGG